VAGSFSMGFSSGKLPAIDQRLGQSFGRASSNDADFRNIAVSGRTSFGGHSSLFVSHVNKEFGAQRLLWTGASREWTNQTLVSFRTNWTGARCEARVSGILRDPRGTGFSMTSARPEWFSKPPSHSRAGATIKTNFRVAGAGSVTLGGEGGGDWIASNRLGNHSFGRTSLFSEFQWLIGKSAAIYPGLRFDSYSNFGSALNPSLSGSWWMLRA